MISCDVYPRLSLPTVNQALACILIIITSTLFAFPVQAGNGLESQSPKWSAEAAYQAGILYKHTSNMLVDPSGLSQTWEAGFVYQSYGKQYWNSGLNYPALGISLGQLLMPNRDTMGIATGLLPHIRFTFLRKKSLEAYVRLGVGLAWVNKKFDPELLPTNTAISSSLNNWSQIKLGIQYRIHKQWSLQVNGTFNHLSNAGIQLPNLGTNHFTAGISAQYHIKTTEPEAGSYRPPLYKNAYWLRIGYGTRKRDFEGDIRYFHITNIYGGYARNTSSVNRILLGVQTGFDTYNRDRYKRDAPANTPSVSAAAMHMSIVAGDEILVGRLGLMAMVGIYTWYPEYKPDWMYWRLGINIHSKPLGKNERTRYFFGVSLKAHETTAEHFEMAAGITF